MDVRIEQSWKVALAGEFEKPYFASLVRFLRQEKIVYDIIINKLLKNESEVYEKDKHINLRFYFFGNLPFYSFIFNISSDFYKTILLYTY